MQATELVHLLQQPELIASSHTEAIKSLCTDYPYFQSARALYLKVLKNSNSYRYNTALKTTAAYTTDRSVLFDFITSETFNQNEISQQIKQNSEYIKAIEVNAIDDISVNKSVTLDDTLKQQVADTKGVLNPNLFHKKTETGTEEKVDEDISSIINQKLTTPETKLNIGRPLEFDASETHSFFEWLNITRFEPIKRDAVEPAPTNDAQPLKNKLDVIDKFISENPKIKPSQNPPKPKLVNTKDSIEDSLMTETLARIYLEQKKYKKAIQAYRILSLKYPEKSGFFADQIKAVKELKEQNND